MKSGQLPCSRRRTGGTYACAGARNEYRDTYLELRMDKSDITGDYILMITDFAPDGDTDTLEDIWDANMEMLHRSTGL